jgi:hypothetical protein
MRPPAKLSGELLARKGEALPTGGFAYARLALDHPLPPPGATALVRYAAAPASMTVARNDSRKGAPERRREPSGRRAEDRVALTVRLDRDRHRRLRIFGARQECSSQDVIIRALDAYFASCGDRCACLRGESEGCVRN